MMLSMCVMETTMFDVASDKQLYPTEKHVCLNTCIYMYIYIRSHFGSRLHSLFTRGAGLVSGGKVS